MGGDGTLPARFMTDVHVGKMMVHCHVIPHEDTGAMSQEFIGDSSTTECSCDEYGTNDEKSGGEENLLNSMLPQPPDKSPQSFDEFSTTDFNCIETYSSSTIEVKVNEMYELGDVYCLEGGYQFGLKHDGTFGYFVNSVVEWRAGFHSAGSKWVFQGDGNLAVYGTQMNAVWASSTVGESPSLVISKKEGVRIKDIHGTKLWNKAKSVNCIETTLSSFEVKVNELYGLGDVYCLEGGYQFGLKHDGTFGYFVNSRVEWSADISSVGSKWVFQSDGNLVLYDTEMNAVWASGTIGESPSLILSKEEGVRIENIHGTMLWRAITTE